jgi:Golgi phosphoprotein 3 (GPP34)
MADHPGQHAGGGYAGQHRVRGPAASPLAGTGLVADDLYLMAHHEMSGRALLQPRPLGLGLAGALLAEVMLDGGLTVRHDGLALPRNIRPADDLALRTWEQIASESGLLPLRDWLLFLARTTAADVALRLERAGYLTRVRSLAPWRPARWVPVEADWAFASLLRVRAALDPARRSGPGEAALTGLAAACGLGFRLEEYLAPGGPSPGEVTAYLHPDLRELVTQTQAAVDGALLSHRT